MKPKLSTAAQINAEVESARIKHGSPMAARYRRELAETAFFYWTNEEECALELGRVEDAQIAAMNARAIESLCR